MNLNHYNYILNGISHKIELKNNIKFKGEPLPQKILLSNKYFIKILNDLFDYLSIEYIPINSTLLGQNIFQGIHIFDDNLEFIIEKNNFKKLLKEKNYLIENNILFHFINQEYVCLRMNIIDNYFSVVYIYLFENENNIIHYYDKHKNKFQCHFYDIFPIQKKRFEEFEISNPNKIDELLNQQFNLNYIEFISYYHQVERLNANHPHIFKIIIYLVFLMIFQEYFE